MLKVSIIIPIFNCEKYLHRAIRSALQQSYTNIEVILVDDGSTDESGKICDSYLEIDSRIKIVHKPNGGLSSARNAGLKIATGEYISFLDSDDWFDSDLISSCIRLIEDNENVDAVQFGVATVSDPSEHIKKKKNIKIETLEGKDILWHLMYHSTVSDLYFSVCRCLFSRHLFESIRFPEGKINEDIAVKYKLFSQAKKVVDTNAVYYYYFQDEGSITTSGFKAKDFDLYDAAAELVKLTENESYKKIDRLGKVKYARTSLSLLCKISYFGWSNEDLNKKKIVRSLQKDLRTNCLFLLKSPIKFSRKVLTVLFSTSFVGTTVLIRIMKGFGIC